jgi:hypothetical protein
MSGLVPISAAESQNGQLERTVFRLEWQGVAGIE